MSDTSTTKEGNCLPNLGYDLHLMQFKYKQPSGTLELPNTFKFPNS